MCYIFPPIGSYNILSKTHVFNVFQKKITFPTYLGVVSLEVPIGINSFIVTTKNKKKNVLTEHE
jgi:hypothetical protein